jgi:hypothetical protein
MEGKSTLTNIFHFMRFGQKKLSFLKRIREANQTRSIKIKQRSFALQIDKVKAFDKVDHQILLQKMETWGFNAQLLKVLEEYLTGRFVTYEGVKIKAEIGAP